MKMNLSSLKLITFDITGTILKFKRPIGKLYCDAGAAFDIKCNEEQMKKNFKKEWIYMEKLHPNFGQKDIGWRNWWSILICNCFKDFNPDKNKQKKIANYLIDNFTTMKYWELSDGVLELLNYLKQQSVCLGVISNFDDRLETILENANLQQYFKFVLYSYKVGIQKPSTKIFELALRKSQIYNIQSKQCLHIGDNYELDFISAKNAGWKAILINEDLKDEVHYANLSKNEICNNFKHVSKLLI